jgi:hypothetical protein
LANLSEAADAAGITAGQVAQNIASTAPLLCVLAAEPVPVPAPEPEALAVAKAGSAAEQQYILAVAYQPGMDPRIAKGVDGGRDFFSEVELEKAAWTFLRNSPRVGLFHADGTDQNGGAATVVESYVYRNEQPWDLGDGVVVTKGTWLVGMVLDDRAWALHKAGKIGGISPQGVARRRRVS